MQFSVSWPSRYIISKAGKKVESMILLLATAAQEVHSGWPNAMGLLGGSATGWLNAIGPPLLLGPSGSCALQGSAMQLFHAMDIPLLPSKDFSEMGTCSLEFFNMQA